MNKINLFLRILVSPFVLGLLIVTFIYGAVKRWLHFLKYGGEFINYEKGIDSKTIFDTYIMLKEKLEN